MSKDRSIGYLMEMYKDVSRVLSKVYDAEDTIRRRIYPKTPPKDFNIRNWCSGFNAAVMLDEIDAFGDKRDHRLCVIQFGYSYSYHAGKITDSWSKEIYSGPDDDRLWKRAHGEKGTPFPGNTMERLAWEGRWPEYVGLQWEKEAREYLYLESRSRQLENRRWTILQGVEKIVDAVLREQGVGRYSGDNYYQQLRKFGPQLLLGNIPAYYEGTGYFLGT